MRNHKKRISAWSKYFWLLKCERCRSTEDPYNINYQKLWRKLSIMPVYLGLNLKNSFVWKKKKRIKISEMSSILVHCSLKCRLRFCTTDNFRVSFIVYCFIMFTQDLMEELTRIWIHIHITFNSRASFKILFSMCLLIVEKELWT